MIKDLSNGTVREDDYEKGFWNDWKKKVKKPNKCYSLLGNLKL